jgi:L-cysteine S-thiosulfotransferase
MKTVSAVLVYAALLTACMPGPESARGFRLPDGDADRGLAAFTELECHACHSVEGLELEYPGTGAADVKLGGTVTRVKTYGELVTSIINPSHKLAPSYRRDEVSTDGESLMTLASVNDVMTVQQLIDLVAFLQTRYEVVPPQYDPYGYVYP